MNNRVSHLIEVRTVGDNGEVKRKDPLDPLDSNFNSPVQPSMLNGARTAAATTGIVLAQAISSFARNYGRITGDYIARDKMNVYATLVGYASQIAVNPLAGIYTVTTDIGNKIMDFEEDRVLRQRDVDQLKERVGMIRSSGGR